MIEDIQGSMLRKDAESFTKQVAWSEIHHLYHEKIDFTVKVYSPTPFEALRKLYCGPYHSFIKSVFASDMWRNNSGGKSRSTFFKSIDNKYILKAVQSREIKMFNDMSKSYFEYLCGSFSSQCPSAIAKTLGIYKIKIKVSARHRTEQFYFVLMENLLLGVDEANVIMYDLKGSRRNRFIANPEPGQVTLDNNFLNDYNSRPIAL